MIHLHAYSNYSLLEGIPSPTDLASTAAKSGMSGLALTDHHWLTGAVEFYNACKKFNIKPILGLVLDILNPSENITSAKKKTSPLLLLAMDRPGWANLCRLSSAALSDSRYSFGKALTLEKLAANSTGLICLTGGTNGMLTSLIREGAERAAGHYLARLQKIFPERLYIELQHHDQNDDLWNARLAAMAKQLDLPLVATHSIYYLEPPDSELQKVVTAIRENKSLDQLTARETAPNNAYFASQEEMAEYFKGHISAIEASQTIADRCQLELPLGKAYFPQITLSDGETPIEALQRKAQAGAQVLYPGLPIKVRKRLEHELSVIDECGFAPLFLVMEEIVKFARKQDIPTSSRGSAASSLIAHCLGITTPDPMRLNLYFERFLNPARVNPPDIDTDLCSRRRNEVLNYVYQHYDTEKVAMVCTINRFRTRSALREVSKVYGLSEDQIKRFTRNLPRRWFGPSAKHHQKKSPFGELEIHYTSPEYKQIFSHAREILGFPRHLSVHPGGIVIAPGELTDLVPTQMAQKGVTITQFDLHTIEQVGLIKIDLLGIRGLTVLNDVAASVKARKEQVVDFLDAIPIKDPLTSDLIQNGKTIGCFQIESPGMRATLKEIQARSIDDIMVALALYRPGPLRGGLKDAFVRRHRKQEAPAYLHPSMEYLLADTYGVILYQEQVLRIAHELAGLSLSDADLLRRAMSHFDPGAQMKTLKEKFIQGAYQHSGVPLTTGERVWEMMSAFAGYGFPKAHAASYAEISWRSAWCKTHYPAFFMAAVLANWGGYYSQRVYLMEARRLGLNIRPPHINYAHREFSISFIDEKPVLFMGLDQVRELRQSTQERIIQERPFSSLQDFLTRVDPRPQEAENLIKAGTLQGLGSIPALLSQSSSGGWRKGQLTMFPRKTNSEDEWSIPKQAAAQESILGVSIIAHPLELFADEIARLGAVTSLEAVSKVGKHVRIAGMRQFWRRSETRYGKVIYIMTLEDLEGMINVLIPSDIYNRSKKELSGSGPYLIEGLVEIDEERGEPFLRAEQIELLKRW
jgi:DNA-directed DNA polymerase III PolC